MDDEFSEGADGADVILGCQLFLAGFAPDLPIPVQFIRDALAEELRDAYWHQRALDQLIASGWLLADAEEDTVVVAPEARRWLEGVITKARSWQAIYSVVEATIHHALLVQDGEQHAIQQLLPQARAVADRAVERQSEYAYDLYSVVGDILARFGSASAIPYLERAVALYMVQPQGEARVVVGSLLGLSRFALTRGDRELACAHLRRAVAISEVQLGVDHAMTIEIRTLLQRVSA